MVKFAPRTVLKFPAPVAANVTAVGSPGGTTVFTVPAASVVQLALPPETVFQALSKPPFQYATFGALCVSVTVKAPPLLPSTAEKPLGTVPTTKPFVLVMSLAASVIKV
jgi:hypothetical protein